MKRVLLAASAALALGAVSTPALAQSGTVSAEIVIPISVTYQRDLRYGLIAPSASDPVTIHIDATDNTTAAFSGAANGAQLLTSSQGSGHVEFEAASGATFDVTVAGGNTFNLSNGTESMSVTLALSDDTDIAGAGSGTPIDVWVGGDLTVAADQTVGVYNGTYTLVATYD